MTGLVCQHLATLEAPLVILDNFEHLMDAVPFVVDLLESSARLKVVVTSRLVLRIYGEQEFPVLPLPLPPSAPSLSPEDILAFASVALFVQRAAAVRPSFRVTPENASAIGEICRRFRAGGNLEGVASAMSCLGDVAAAQKNYVLARTHYKQSLELFRQLNDRGVEKRETLLRHGSRGTRRRGAFPRRNVQLGGYAIIASANGYRALCGRSIRRHPDKRR